jgi:hypothetical protein
LLLCCNDKKVAVDAVRVVNAQQEMYVLSVDTSHIFCVTPYRILAHNVEPAGTAVVATLALVFPPAAAAVTVAEIIVLGIVGISAYRAYKKSQQNKQYERYPVYSDVVCNCGGKPPKHEDDKEEHPHGIYEDAGYHHPNSYGNKSPCPQNGQKCLDNSLLIEDSVKQRVGIEGDKFVVFKQTASGKFHGYVVSWKDIVSGGNSHTEAIRKTLLRSGWVTKSGKIVKELVK